MQCGQLYPQSLTSSVSGAVGVGRISSNAALVAYGDGGLGVYSLCPGSGAASPQDRLTLLSLSAEGGPSTSAFAPALAPVSCLSACPFQAESQEHFVGTFAAAHGRGGGITLGRVLVSRAGGKSSPEAAVTVLSSVPVESAPGVPGAATALHMDKHQFAYGTAEGGVTLRHLHDAMDAKFYLAKGRRGQGAGSGPHCHAVSTCWYASDIVVAAG
jgi:hypothetical protein